MKNAIILHGAGDGPESYWIPYLKTNLEQRGFNVWAPQLPGADDPQLPTQLPFVLQNGKFDSGTVIIGHSAGCPLILSVLENIRVKIKQAILVAGYCSPLPVGANNILQQTYDWEKIKSHVADITFINSDNDPWKCDDKQGQAMSGHLGGTLIIHAGEGHMGSGKYNQPYKEFPLLLKLINL